MFRGEDFDALLLGQDLAAQRVELQNSLDLIAPEVDPDRQAILLCMGLMGAERYR